MIIGDGAERGAVVGVEADLADDAAVRVLGVGGAHNDWQRIKGLHIYAVLLEEE